MCLFSTRQSERKGCFLLNASTQNDAISESCFLFRLPFLPPASLCPLSCFPATTTAVKAHSATSLPPPTTTTTSEVCVISKQ